MVLFGYPKYKVPHYNRDPKKDQKFRQPPICLSAHLRTMHAEIKSNGLVYFQA